MRQVLFGVVVFVGSLSVSAQQRGANYERVLVPIVIRNEVPGAYGSRWATRLAITNTAAQPVDVLGYEWAPRGCIILCADQPLTQPGVTFYPALLSGQFTQGAILLIDRRAANDIAVNLRVQDVSRASQTWGTEIPVIREAGLFRSRFTILDVPVEQRFRQSLRFYDPDARSDARAIVRFYRVTPTIDTTYDATNPPRSDTLLGQRTIALQIEQRAGGPMFDLGYAEISNLAGLPELQGVDRVRIEIEPATSNLRLWAFVSVTNNETQHVTVLTPQ
jgi:hypothetical protein